MFFIKQALTEVSKDFLQKWITAKMAQVTLIWHEFNLDKILQQTHKITETYYHNYFHLAWHHMLFYMHLQHMVPDYCIKYE